MAEWGSFSSPETSKNDEDTAAEKWEELLRKMLPVGAPLPDEEHLDYSIAVEYQGPPPQFSKTPSSFSWTKAPKFTSSLSRHRTPSSFSHRSNLISNPYWDRRDYVINRCGDSDVEIDTSCSNSSSSWSNLHAITVDEVENKGNSVLVECHTNTGVDEIGRKVCRRCRKGTSLVLTRGRGERCLVCDALYCRNCVLKAMGSMPEGRKCVGCIGMPINEAKRDSLGKCSRLLAGVLSPLEVQQTMKAEKECFANRIRPEHVVVNGRPLRAEELANILGCVNPPKNLRPGKYWYDKDSGLWGKEGEKPDRVISAKLNVGGKLPGDASNGNTKVYINGREITKVELKLLRLVKVQCPPDTRFWLYEDGSYDEEGQNNIRGNIWTKAFNRLICSLFSLPLPPRNPHGPEENPTTFLSSPLPKCLGERKIKKLLLLGLEGAGTTTIFKQVKFIKGNKFTAEELQNIKLRVQSNVYKYLSILLEGRECFENEVSLKGKTPDLTAEISLQDQSNGAGDNFFDGRQQGIYSVNERLKEFSDWLLNILVTGDLGAVFPAEACKYAPMVDEVWKDPAIQETYKRRDELCIPDVAKYFLDRATEILSNEYEPSEEDILYAEGVTPSNGVAFLEFTSDDDSPISGSYTENYDLQFALTKYQLVLVESNRMHDHCKWLEMFQGFQAVVFCVALTDYDQVFSKGTSSFGNKMLASRDLFESLVRHSSFEETPFVLLLNKYDAFEEKIKRVPLTVCEWFHDFRPLKHHHSSQSLAEQAYFYIAVRFKMFYSSITGRKIFVWQTRARDRSSVDEAFKYIREVIRWNEEDRNLLSNFENDESFSTEISSPYTRKH